MRFVIRTDEPLLFVATLDGVCDTKPYLFDSKADAERWLQDYAAYTGVDTSGWTVAPEFDHNDWCAERHNALIGYALVTMARHFRRPLYTPE